MVPTRLLVGYPAKQPFRPLRRVDGEGVKAGTWESGTSSILGSLVLIVGCSKKFVSL